MRVASFSRPRVVIMPTGMQLLLVISVGVSSFSFVAWLYLLLARGFFWRTDIHLDAGEAGLSRAWPSVGIVVPARNEAGVLPQTLPTLLGQEYPGAIRVYLIDDQSSDGTTEAARNLADKSGSDRELTLIEGSPPPSGWTGKVWAMEQGVRAASLQHPDYLWLTDADIAHGPRILEALVAKAESEDIALVSLAAQLHCRGFWERLLVPAFIYFFAKLFPFRWVNDRDNSAAAAAGGCMLVRRESLETAGGLQSIANAIIDDCALARLIKGSRPGGTKIWLGLGHDIDSVRHYAGLWPFWGMVARTAYTQLRYSVALLFGTMVGMTLVYLVPLAALVGGRVALWVTGEYNLALSLVALGLAGLSLMFASYLPMLRWYRTSSLFALLLPLAALLYTMMTLDSARRHWQGRGGAWKGRTYNRNLDSAPS